MIAVSRHFDPDSLAAVVKAVFADREYQWTEGSGTYAWLMGRLQRLLDWLEGLRVSFPLPYYVLLGAMVLLLAGLVAHLSWVVWRSLHPHLATGTPAAMAGPIRDAAWHLAEARRLGAAGQFAEALAHRFLAAMLELDAHRVLQVHPSKTPAEYVQEARLDDTGRSELADLVAALYRHLFGGAPCGADEWQRFDSLASGLGLHAATR